MITIKMLCDIEKLNKEGRLPNTIVKFLEKQFSDLHEALEPETDLARFSLEMYGPVFVPVAVLLVFVTTQ